jgi:hypothetical protein
MVLHRGISDLSPSPFRSRRTFLAGALAALGTGLVLRTAGARKAEAQTNPVTPDTGQFWTNELGFQVPQAYLNATELVGGLRFGKPAESGLHDNASPQERSGRNGDCAVFLNGALQSAIGLGWDELQYGLTDLLTSDRAIKFGSQQVLIIYAHIVPGGGLENANPNVLLPLCP